VSKFEGIYWWAKTDLYYLLLVLTNEYLGPILEGQPIGSVQFRD
jgi:hypothetical protein